MSELGKKPEDFALEHAGFWIRLGACIIDALILVLIPYIIYRMFAACMTFPAISIHTIVFISWFIELAYFTGFWIWRGQTPGKMVLGIKVIRTDSSDITFAYALLRYLGYIISTMTIFIGFIWIAFDSHKQGLHDKIADTYVVKLPVRQVILTKSYAGGRIG